MNLHDANDQEIFKTGIQISEPVSWLQSILNQLRQRKEDREAPHATVTAAPDPTALDKFVKARSPLASILWTLRDIKTDKSRHYETTAAPVEVQELWSADKSGFSGLLSLGVHGLIIAILVVPVATGILKPLPTPQDIVMLTPPPKLIAPVLQPAPGKSGGGGGGGMKTPTPPSKGQLPRGADKQIMPPMIEAKNLAPQLVVEQTIIAPQLNNVPLLGIPIGDPNGVNGPPSAGPGVGGGIGTGPERAWAAARVQAPAPVKAVALAAAYSASAVAFPSRQPFTHRPRNTRMTDAKPASRAPSNC